MNWIKLILIIFFLIIFCGILFGFNKLSSVVIEKKFSNAPEIKFVKFYEKHSKELNHLRDPRGLNIKNINELMFTLVGESSKKKILIQGDSWGEQFLQKESLDNLEEKNDDNYSFILAGTSSYSPSVFTVQLRKIREEFNINPISIITLVDQTDIGDELCRYKKYRKYVNNKLIISPYENFSGQTYETYKPIERWKIIGSNNSDGIKVLKLAIFKVKELLSKKNKTECSWSDISNPLIVGVTKEEKEWFKKIMDEYIQMVFSNSSLENLFLLTHPHQSHLNGTYQLNVHDLLKEIIEDSLYENNIYLIDVYEYSKKINPNQIIEKIYKKNDAASHVTNKYHSNVYVNLVLDTLKYTAKNNSY